MATNLAISPAVSVLVAAYNEDDYLRQALESVRSQDFRDFEVVIVDDANQTTTQRLVESFDDPRLRYVSNEVRRGPAGTYWRAMTLARGRYFAILNQDDTWKRGFLNELVPTLDADSGVTVAFSDHDLVDGEGRLLKEATDAASIRYKRNSLVPGVQRSLPQLLLDQTLPMAVAAVFRSDVIRAEREALFASSGPAYDFCLAVLVCVHGQNAYYVAQRLTCYRVHARAQSRSRSPAWAIGSAICWKAFAEEAKDPLIRKRSLEKASRAYVSAALANLRAGDRKEARECAESSMRVSLSRMGLGAFLLSLAPRRVVTAVLS